MNHSILNLSRKKKQVLMLIFDSLAVVGILFTSIAIRLGYWYVPENAIIWAIVGSPILAIPIFVYFRLYRSVIRYIGYTFLWSIGKAVSIYCLIWGLIVSMSGLYGVPRSVVFINWMLCILVIGGSRIFARWLLTIGRNSSESNVIIYGAGEAGIQLSNALQQSSEFNQVAFIDDNHTKQERYINSIPVMSFSDASLLIRAGSVVEVLLAIPSISLKQRNKIIERLRPLSINVRSLPSIIELAQGKVKIDDLRDISIKELLGRDSVPANAELLGKNITNKVVMVTGAGGSIGAELSRQILFLKPQTLILFEQSEFALYSIEKELSEINPTHISIFPVLGSVINVKRLKHIMNKFNINTIYHAAAYKHVPMVESNNAEGVSNNVFGTLNCAQVAIDSGVETFVMISTDKAVRPTNTMGASKRIAELILQALTLKHKEVKHKLQGTNVKKTTEVKAKTRFSIVRFGNVMNSSGSVIPLFREQIKKGGPVTVTDPKILRYFMYVDEAVELVIQAGSMGEGGDVFVLDMGQPVLIIDLAKKMIQLSGLKVKDKSTPEGDIEIKFTGIRPGEKLYEELLIGDNISETSNPMIMSAEEEMMHWDDLKLILDELKIAVDESNQEMLRDLLIKAVPGFSPQHEITDILYNV